ncbi:MAG: hypothetical protein WB696_31150, partial [Chthoniobacterales bacterium]
IEAASLWRSQIDALKGLARLKQVRLFAVRYGHAPAFACTATHLELAALGRKTSSSALSVTFLGS